jgi:hypothetical protein
VPAGTVVEAGGVLSGSGEKVSQTDARAGFVLARSVMCAMIVKPGLARRLRWRSEIIIRPIHHVHITTSLPRWRSNRQRA